MHRQWHHAWALANSAAVCVNNSAASIKSAAGADDNLDSGRSKACEAVMLAVGNWLMGEHANAVAAVLGAVIGSLRQFLMWGRSWQNMG